MDYSQLIRKRYSVRSYLDKPVEKNKLDYVLEAGRIAPTAANRQPQAVIAVTSEQGLETIDKACNRFGGPVVLVVCADHSQTWKRSYDNMDSAYIDASIVTDHMMLAAADSGLGSLWICKFDPSVIRNGFGLPDHVEPINILCLGYASTEAEQSPAASPDRHERLRKPIDSTVKYEKWQ